MEILKVNLIIMFSLVTTIGVTSFLVWIFVDWLDDLWLSIRHNGGDEYATRVQRQWALVIIAICVLIFIFT